MLPPTIEPVVQARGRGSPASTIGGAAAHVECFGTKRGRGATPRGGRGIAASRLAHGANGQARLQWQRSSSRGRRLMRFLRRRYATSQRWRAPTALPPRYDRASAPRTALARTSAAAPKRRWPRAMNLLDRSTSRRRRNSPVHPVAYAVAPGIDVGEPSEAEQVVDAAHSEEAATAESGGASLAVVEFLRPQMCPVQGRRPSRIAVPC